MDTGEGRGWERQRVDQVIRRAEFAIQGGYGPHYGPWDRGYDDGYDRNWRR